MNTNTDCAVGIAAIVLTSVMTFPPSPSLSHARTHTHTHTHTHAHTHTHTLSLTRYMYWTDWGDKPRIERASMDGQNRMVLHSTNVVWPNALTVDYSTQTLYWIDAKLDYIESSFRDGSRRQILYREKNVHFRPFGLTFYRDRLFMVDIDAREVRSFLVKSTTSELSTIVTDDINILEPMSVVAVHESRQPYGKMSIFYRATNWKNFLALTNKKIFTWQNF